MELKRKPFQGILNIIRFNWHFYLIACLSILFIFLFGNYFPKSIQIFSFWAAYISILTITTSLIVSFYIYDISDLYEFNWLVTSDNKKILNINAGFDETSVIIKRRYPNSKLTICDFYNPDKHTEISIKRARQIYPQDQNTIQVSTQKLPFADNSFDISLCFLATHEIRNESERIDFFKELNRVTKTTGQIFVTEHLRDVKNFSAYTIGFFHFYSKSNWLRIFLQSNLTVKQEIKTTPFITTFIIEKFDDTF
ncbi:methyltransferase domain-containing protein [Spirosoma sp. BT702]|uniref:Methyltransferase domain-containing protein n=1 Tax=Spirosoma profusum TaxID=2771354 RepID=A0A926Y1N8_9BACT|nr:methyltransferase domain-containing protein [Spirosoma profusum]MBD2704365.1 methyltransferase domain-containing protein [Spirosoma profusum]